MIQFCAFWSSTRSKAKRDWNNTIDFSDFLHFSPFLRFSNWQYTFHVTECDVEMKTNQYIFLLIHQTDQLRNQISDGPRCVLAFNLNLRSFFVALLCQFLHQSETLCRDFSFPIQFSIKSKTDLKINGLFSQPSSTQQPLKLKPPSLAIHENFIRPKTL